MLTFQMQIIIYKMWYYSMKQAKPNIQHTDLQDNYAGSKY